MAEVTIQDLTEVTDPLTDDDVVALQRNGATEAERIKISDLRNELVTTRIKPNVSPAIVYGSASSLDAVTVTADATPHTKGSWTELIAATDQDYSCLEVYVESTNINGSVTSSLLDIGFGASSSEVVVAADLIAGYKAIAATASTVSCCYIIPINIPAGTRISARMQSVISAHTAGVTVRPTQLPPTVRKSYAIDTIGADLANSRGVVLTIPGALNTKGAYTQITASTLNKYIAMVVGVQGANGNSFSNGAIGMDIATGGSGSEVNVINDLIYTAGTAETVAERSPRTNLFYVDIPAGTRLSARFQRSATNLMADVILYGVREL